MPFKCFCRLFAVTALILLLSALSTRTVSALEVSIAYGNNAASQPDHSIVAFLERQISRAAVVEAAGRVDADQILDTRRLEESAAALLRQGKFAEADKVYSQLVKVTLNNPEKALPYAFIKWHLRQGYEAQALLLRALRSGGLSVGNAELVKNTLDEAYDTANVLGTIHREFADPADAEALANLETYWEDACKRIQQLEVENDQAGLADFTKTLFGDSPARIFHATWRGYSLLYREDFDAAVMELDFALESAPDPQSEAEVVAGLRLIREFRRSALSSELLERVSEVVSGLSTAVGEQISASQGIVQQAFERSDELLRERDFPGAAEALAVLRPLFLDTDQRQRYIYLLAEIQWGSGQLARANQAYIAAQALSRDRYIQSGSLINMAEYAFSIGRREDAAAFAARSAAALPDQSWKLRQVGSFFVALGMPDRGIAYLERSLEASTTLESDAASYSELAEAYKRIGERQKYLKAAGDYIATVAEFGAEATRDQSGTRYYYQGEIFASSEKPDEAYAAYEQAAELVTDRFRLAEILMNMAQYQAARDNGEDAVALAVRSAELLPDQDWKLRQVGEFLLRAGKREEAVTYLERSLDVAQTPAGKAASYASLAEAYRDMGDQGGMLRYAEEYVNLEAANRETLSDAEAGLAAFYRAEILMARENAEQALAEYDRAAGLVAENYRRSDIYMKMAEVELNLGDKARAAQLAERSAEELPDGWRLRQVGDFFIRLDMPDKAFEYFSRYAQNGPSPDNQASVYATMADAYKNQNNMQQFANFARRYTDAVTAEGYAPSSAEMGLSAFYQAEIYSAAGNEDLAFHSYEIAIPLLDDPNRLADAYMNMANYRAEKGEADEAARLAELSAASLPEAWKQEQVGNFLIGLGMQDRAFAYFENYARQASSATDRASVYATMAEAALGQSDRERYLHFAAEYVAAIAAADHTSTSAEEGLAAFYQAEILMSQNEAEQAFRLYEQASSLLEDKPKRAEALFRMAELQAEEGNVDRAASLAEQSAAEQPVPWKQRQVADFLLRLNLADRAAVYFERAGDQGGRAAVYATLADAYKEMGKQELYLQTAAKYVGVVNADDYSPTSQEQALSAFYEGEILAGQDNPVGAFEAYGRAAELTSDKFLQSDLYMKMAELRASANDREQAALYAGKAAAALPNQDWKLQQVAELYDRLEMPEKAIEYFREVARVSQSARTRALARSSLAEVYKKMNDQEKYLAYAAEYVAAVVAGDFVPSREDEGLRYLYEGDTYEAAGDPDSAYQAYEQASRLVSEKYRLSDLFIRMARYQVKNGDRDRAIEYAERSRELIPDQAWRVMEVGDIYANLGFTDKAIECYKQVVELTPAAGNRTAIYGSLAEVYKKLGDRKEYVDYARLYNQALAAREGEISDNEKALSLFYRGESEAYDGEDDKAYQSFEEAAGLFTDKFRLSDIAMKQAEYHAKQDEIAEATAFAEKSAAILPDEPWRQKGTGDFFSDLNLMDKALFYYERNLALSKTPETRAAAYSALADAYRKMDDKERYIAMARAYIAEIALKDGELSNWEKAQQGYLLGEIRTAEGDLAGAYAAYGYAAQFIEDKFRLSDVYMTMAKYNLEHGDKDLGARQALEAADLLLDQDWRVQGAMDLLGEHGRLDDAVALAEKMIAINAQENMSLYRSLGQMYLRAKNRKRALYFNAKYIDLLTEKVNALGAASPQGERDELWNARNWQNGTARVWGLDSYYFGKRWPSTGDYFLGMSHELFRYYNLPNGMHGKMYATFGGTLKALYSGHYLENSMLHPWESRPRLPDTSQVTVGINLNPFKGLFFSSISFSAEYLFGTGRDQEDDFRFRTGFDVTSGDKPRASGKYWKYWKAYSNTIYSTRYNDVTSQGDYRLGVTIANGPEKDFLIMPHVLATHSYGGKSVDKGARWGFDVGAGLSIRKWFRWDKHTTPQSYVDLQVYYHHSLTHDRESGPGFTLTTSF